MPKNRSITLGVIVGNRNFFPDALVTEGRRDVLEVLAERGIEPVILDEQSTKLGGVETWQDAKKCAALFDEHRHRINGILVVLPNFGDEKAVAETIKLCHIRATVKTNNNDLTFSRSLKSCVGAERHGVVTRDETLNVWELLDDCLRLLEGFRLIPVGTLGGHLLQLGILA